MARRWASTSTRRRTNSTLALHLRSFSQDTPTQGNAWPRSCIVPAAEASREGVL